MACFRPKAAFENNEGGRPVFHADDPRAGLPLMLPCNKCIGCRTAQKGDWGARSAHEAQVYGFRNSFATFTYDDAHLPVGNVLRVRDFQLMIKRLREFLDPVKIRYLMCGEYGGTTGRAHFHANFYNLGLDDGWFPDLKRYGQSKSGEDMFVLQTMTDLWGHGQVWLQRGNAGAYIAAHNEKKAAELAAVGGDEWRLPGKHCVLHVDSLGRLRPLCDLEGNPVVWVPSFLRGSMHPGIGLAWIEQYAEQTFSHGCLTARGGHKSRIPRYYKDVAEAGRLEFFTYGRVTADTVAELKERQRLEAMEASPDDQTPDRLKVREFCKLEAFRRRAADVH